MQKRRTDAKSLLQGGVSSRSEVLFQELPDREAILLNLDTESYFGLDPVATTMYRALTAAPTVASAYEALQAEFNVEPERLKRDLHAFVQTLLANGLVEFHS